MPGDVKEDPVRYIRRMMVLLRSKEARVLFASQVLPGRETKAIGPADG
jgi:hypothetical protein